MLDNEAVGVNLYIPVTTLAGFCVALPSAVLRTMAISAIPMGQGPSPASLAAWAASGSLARKAK